MFFFDCITSIPQSTIVVRVLSDLYMTLAASKLPKKGPVKQLKNKFLRKKADSW